MHIENVQERQFLEINKSNAKKYPGFGVQALGYKGGGIGV